jgi:predicted metal-binding membrane protein
MTNTVSVEPSRARRTASDRAFLGVSALLFVVSTTATVAWSTSMPMPWMPMCGQTQWSLAASFLGMWSVMMMAMMLPSLVLMLLRYRAAIHAVDEPRLCALTARVGTGYLAVWAVVGTAVFALDRAWPMVPGAVPSGTGAIIVAAGVWQLSAWRAHHLAHCRAVPAPGAVVTDAGAAWRYGLRLGWHCVGACAGLTAILIAVGVMDLYAMAAVSAAITLERFAPAGRGVARAVTVVVGVGLLVIGAVFLAGFKSGQFLVIG